jgi:hypothetical protein
MPEEGKTYTSQIRIAGNIDAKLFADIKKLVGHNAQPLHLAAKEACQGRDSRSKRREDARERARDLLDAL